VEGTEDEVTVVIDFVDAVFAYAAFFGGGLDAHFFVYFGAAVSPLRESLEISDPLRIRLPLPVVGDKQ